MFYKFVCKYITVQTQINSASPLSRSVLSVCAYIIQATGDYIHLQNLETQRPGYDTLVVFTSSQCYGYAIQLLPRGQEKQGIYEK